MCHCLQSHSATDSIEKMSPWLSEARKSEELLRLFSLFGQGRDPRRLFEDKDCEKVSQQWDLCQKD